MKNRFFQLSFVSTIATAALILVATTFAQAQGLNYSLQAHIKDQSGNDVEEASVNFRFSITDPAGTCILYSEDFSGVSMTGTKGIVKFNLGSGSRNFPAAGTTKVIDIFYNREPSYNCQSGATYTPTDTDKRKIVIQFNDGIGGWQSTPAIDLYSVPSATYALKANQLDSYLSSDFLRPSTLPSCTGSQVLSYDGTTFSCTAAGTGTIAALTASTPLSVSGTTTPVVSITQATSATAGYLSSANWSTFNAKQAAFGFTPLSPSNNLSDLASSGTARSNLGLGTAATVNTGTTSGTAPVLDSSAKIATSLLPSDLITATTNLSGDVTGTVSTTSVDTVSGKTSSQITTSVNATLAASSTNTASTIVKRNSSGSFTVTTAQSTNNAVNNIYLVNGSYNVALVAPTLGSSWNLTFPTTAGTSGTVLTTDGSGNLVWQSVASGGGVITSVTATSPVTSSGGGTPNLTVAQSTSSTAGYVSASDWSTFNNKQNALGYTPLNAVNNLSDVASSGTARTNLGVTTVATMAVGTTSGTIAAGDDSRITGALQTTTYDSHVAPAAACTSSQTPYWNSVSSKWACQNIGLFVSQINDSTIPTSLIATGTANSSRYLRGDGTWATVTPSVWATSGTAINYTTGYVGIGIANPTTWLHVTNTSSSTAAKFTGSDDGYVYIKAPGASGQAILNMSSRNGASPWSIYTGSADSKLYFNSGLNTTGSTRLTLDGTTGNVGIGTTTASQLLSVAGMIYSTSGTFKFPDGTTQSTGVTNTSATFITALGYTPMNPANNLNELASTATARTNLGLGSVAALNVGTTAGTVAAGDDSRITGALQATTYNSQVSPATSCTVSQTAYYNTVSSQWACASISIAGSQVTSGYVATARLGSGTADGTTYLRGDGAWVFLNSNQWTTSGTTIYYNTGNVGFNVTNPTEKVDVSSGIRIGAASASNAGTIRFVGTNFQGSNGTTWTNLTGTTAGGYTNCDTTQVFDTSGTYTYNVPTNFATITIQLWGGGGGGGYNEGRGTNGGPSSISSLNLYAGGGTASVAGVYNSSSGGTGGTASGGDVNVNGANGTGAVSNTVTANGGSGGAAFGGTTTLGNNYVNAYNGSVPGGGGSGAASGSTGGGGGGAGGYVKKTFTPLTLKPGTSLNYIVVGAGGTGGTNNPYTGGSGGAGRVVISCSSTGSPAANDRSVVFSSNDSHTNNTNFVYSSANRLGIGVTNPSYKLDVDGDINTSSGDVFHTFGLNIDSIQICTSAGCTSSSDRRLKENLNPLNDSLRKILRTNPVSYNYIDKEKFSDQKQIGVIAQKVEQVFPEVVVTDVQTGLKSVAYDHLVAPVIESIKSLYHKIQLITDKQQNLKRDIANKADQNDVDHQLNQVETNQVEIKDRLKAIEEKIRARKSVSK